MKLTRLLALGLLTVAAPMTFAASTTDVTVTGVITPAACTPSLAGGGDFDLGRISAQDVSSSGTQLPEQQKVFSVICDAPVRFALRGIDGKAGTGYFPGHAYGLGLNGAEKIGFYVLTLIDSLADGNSAVNTLHSTDSGASWSAGWSSPIIYPSHANTLIGVGLAGELEPAAIGRLSANINLRAVLAVDGSTVTDDIQIDGASTIEVVYL